MLANLPAILLDTILTHLTTLFLSGAAGDTAAARNAAQELLATYRPKNALELRLAAQIVSFGLHALAALGQAADPDLPLARVLRLRGSAVSLNRESEKAQRRLDQCQQKRQSDAALPEAAPPELAHPELAHPEPAQPAPEALTEPALSPRQPAVSTNQSWTRATFDEQTEQRIAASLKRAEARVAAIAAARQSIGAP